MIRHVLVVDDEWAVAAALADALDALSRQASVAAGPRQARALLECRRFDLVITDWRMPGEDGLSLASSIRARNAALPVILCTAYAGDDTAVLARRAGCWDVLGKPVDFPCLERVLAGIERRQRLGIAAGDGSRAAVSRSRDSAP